VEALELAPLEAF